MNITARLQTYNFIAFSQTNIESNAGCNTTMYSKYKITFIIYI